MGRGQAALEFLVTYGWAILIFLVTVGALGYFGFLSPESYFPERCEFGSQLLCQDYTIERVNQDESQVSLRLLNNFDRDIEVVNVHSADPDLQINGCSPSKKVAEADELIVRCLIDKNLAPRGKTELPMVITFRNNETLDSPLHNVTGVVYARVPDEIRSTPLYVCNDGGIDNDNNGCADYPDDTGCASVDDPTEAGGTCPGWDPTAPLDCFVSTACPYTEVFRMSDQDDAHASELGQGGFDWYACCHSATDTLDATCGSQQATPLKFSNITNGHVAKNTDPLYNFEACLSASTGTITCRYDTIDCVAGETCLARISADTDAHVGDCTSDFPTRVCCRLT